MGEQTLEEMLPIVKAVMKALAKGIVDTERQATVAKRQEIASKIIGQKLWAERDGHMKMVAQLVEAGVFRQEDFDRGLASERAGSKKEDGSDGDVEPE